MRRMIKGESILCLLIAGIIFYMTYSDQYKHYVSPRLKGYLYLTSIAFIVLWIASLINEQYDTRRVRQAECLKLMIIMGVMIIAGLGRLKGIEDRAIECIKKIVQENKAKDRTKKEPLLEIEVITKGEIKEDWQESKEEDTFQAKETDRGAYQVKNKMLSGHWITGYYPLEKKIKIKDEEFYYWIIEIVENPSEFKGYTIYFNAQLEREDERLQQQEVFLIREVMTCCVADLVKLGIIGIVSPDIKIDNEGKWVSVEGIVIPDEIEHIRVAKIMIKDMHPISPLKEPYVYPPY